MKKIFNTPAASILLVQSSDVIATSVNTPNNTVGNGTQLIQQRQQWDEYEDLDEDF